jgi:hypothetical protein
MNLDFQQGVITYPIDSGLQSFLSYSGGFVSLTTANGRTDITLAYGSENYLLSESSNVTNTWGPLPSSTDCWLYWDINLQTGVRTFGFTTLAPVYSTAPPSSPVENQHWFNTFERKMYVYTSGIFREALRVFAAQANNSTFTPLGTGYAGRPFAGTQAGLTTPNKSAGRIIVGDTGLPVRRSDGKFFTSEDTFFVNGSPVNVIRLEANILTATAYEPIAKFQVVKFSAFGLISLAGYNDTGNTTIAMAMEDLDGQEVGTICVQGHVTNPSWNWQTVGAKLWISEAGVLTNVDPHVANAFVYPNSQVPVARVVTPTSILFDQGLGGKGDRGEPGLAGGVQLATASTYGISRLSVNAADVDAPIVVGDNDPRLNNKVLKAGDTMTGPLVLSANPVTNLGAATKQYVDTKAYTLDSLTDVNTAGAVLNDALVYNGANWLPGTIQGGGFLFQVGVPPTANPTHYHWALMTMAQAEMLIQTTNPANNVADISQPSVVITSSSNGSILAHTHDITVFFDYFNHTFIVTDVTNNPPPGYSDVVHVGYLVGGPPPAIVTIPYDLTLACSDTTNAVAIKTNAAIAVAPRDFTSTTIRGDLLTASSSGSVVATISKNGSVIHTTTITSGSTQGLAANITTFAYGDRITVNITSAGTGAVGLIITMVGTI